MRKDLYKKRDAEFVKSRHVTKYKNQDEITLTCFQVNRAVIKSCSIKKKKKNSYYWRFPEYRWEINDFSLWLQISCSYSGYFIEVLFWTVSESSSARKEASLPISQFPTCVFVASYFRCKIPHESFIWKAFSDLFAFEYHKTAIEIDLAFYRTLYSWS